MSSISFFTPAANLEESFEQPRSPSHAQGSSLDYALSQSIHSQPSFLVIGQAVGCAKYQSSKNFSYDLEFSRHATANRQAKEEASRKLGAIPCPPKGGNTCAASPQSITRPRAHLLQLLAANRKGLQRSTVMQSTRKSISSDRPYLLPG